MGVDYKKQYEPHQLEPFFPNEIVKMVTAVTCTLAILMLLVVTPVALDTLGVPGMIHEEEPANPHGSTPMGIKPEWYFLSVYQHLRLMPTTLLGVSGKTLGVLSQGPAGMLLILLPFLYRGRRAENRSGWIYRIAVTSVIVGFLVLTIWGGWPEEHDPSGGEQLMSPGNYLKSHAMMFSLIGLSLATFYFLLWQETKQIRRVLDEPAPSAVDKGDHR